MTDNNTILIEGVIGEDYSYVTFLEDLQDVLKNNPSSINIAINSLGGYCDPTDKMVSKLNQLTIPIHTFNTGDVCSCASILFMSGTTRTFDYSKGIFVAHNPWSSITGDADQMLEMVHELRTQERKYENIYSSVTGMDKDLISEIMSEDRPLTPEELIKYNFATEVLNGEQQIEFDNDKKKNYNLLNLKLINNVYTAQINNKNNTNMTLLAKIVNAIKNLFLVTKDGVELNIEGDELIPGIMITIGGENANGEFELSDGTIIIAKDGIIEEVKEKEVEQPATVEESKAEEAPIEEPAQEAAQETTNEAEQIAQELIEKIQEISTQIEEIQSRMKSQDEAMIKIMNMASKENINEKNETEHKTKAFGFRNK